MIKQALQTIIDANKEEKFILGLYYAGVGNAPMIQFPDGEKGVFSYFESIKSVFLINGDFNPRSTIAETYAISLALQNKYVASRELFSKIVPNGVKPINKTKVNNSIEPVKNTMHELGFEGIFQFAEVNFLLEKKNEAKALYHIIADALAESSGCIRFDDVRVKALERLVTDYHMKSYTKALAKAKKDQY